MILSAAIVASLLSTPGVEEAIGRPVVVAEKQGPATRASRKLFALVEHIDSTLTESKYQHNTKVRRREGVYLWDCSGMMNWMLARVAPRAREALGRDRPVARTYYRVIQKAPTRRARDGWRQLDDIREVRPGDVFAWLRPPDWPKGGNTGHVGIVVATPRAVDDIENAWAVRVVDASRYTHENDTRDPEGEGGWGMGTIMFVTDRTGSPVAYGWFGTKSRWVHETSIVFGRVTG